MENNQLTQNQKRFYDYIVSYKSDNGLWPTYKCIQKQFRYKSPNSVTQNLQALIEKGYLGRYDNGEYFLIEKSYKTEISGWRNAHYVWPDEDYGETYLTFFPSHGYSICYFEDGNFYYEGTNDLAYVAFWLPLPDRPIPEHSDEYEFNDKTQL